jgi:hypothetical protein
MHPDMPMCRPMITTSMWAHGQARGNGVAVSSEGVQGGEGTEAEATYTFTALSFSAFLSSAVGFTSYLQQVSMQQVYKAVVEVEVGRGCCVQQCRNLYGRPAALLNGLWWTHKGW